MIILTLALASAVFSAEPAPSPAPSNPSVAVTKVAIATPDPNKVVCKTEAVAGSLIPSRTCATNRDWAQRSQNGRDEMDDITRRNDARPTAIGIDAPLHFVPGLH